MSAPRYMVTLSVPGTNLKKTVKLKTILGNHKELAAEIASMNWRQIANNAAVEAGGVGVTADEFGAYYLALIS